MFNRATHNLTALDMPFLLLPFRPGTDPVGSKSFIRNFFKMQYEGTWRDTGLEVRKELMLMEPIVSVLLTPLPADSLLTSCTTGTLRHNEVVLE